MNVAELLRVMVKKGISDIHFKTDASPRVRMNGKIVPTSLERLQASQIEELAAALMTPEQRIQFAAEQELDIAFAVDAASRFRVNLYRQKGSIALTLRVVPAQIKTFEELRLPPAPLRKLASETRGLILIAGVTGAGKTTTLNAMLDYINETFSYNIITVEDPIEYYHADKKSSISQREVGSDTHSYAKALKYVLRQDPDVVVIGEMRDYEAMAAAITAAETGHLVLSTIHTMDAVQTVDRIIDSYPPHLHGSVRSQLSNVLKGVIAQRLVMHKDGNDRLPALEILAGTSLVRKLVAEGKSAEMLKAMEQGAYYGMCTFDTDLLRLFKEGSISMEEALDKASNPDDLTLRMKGIEKAES